MWTRTASHCDAGRGLAGRRARGGVLGRWRRPPAAGATVLGMSTTQRTSATLRIGVPLYLLVIGLGLLAGAVYVFIYEPDELFVVFLAGAGGVTMMLTMVAQLTWARNR
jgi:hypothetical protein